MSTIKVGTLLAADGSTTTQPSIPALDKRMAKVWCSFSMVNQTLYDSYGVSSIADSGVGNTTVNYSTSMAANHYCIALGSHKIQNWDEQLQYTSPNASSVLLRNYTGAIEAIDTDHVSIVIFDN
tara:strand:+ start:318 stop:689 length:372 start_codon:yes stop_codon:yes gene_type:complete